MSTVKKTCLAVSILMVVSGTALAGFIRDWIIVGPFKFEQNADAVRMPFIENGPSQSFRENAVIAGKKCVKYSSPTNYINLERVIPDQNLNNAACYAVTNVYCGKTIKNAKMFIGSDDMIVVYLNGNPVHVFEKGRRSILPDVDCVENVELKKGWNQITAKVINIVGNYSFFVYLADERNEPLGNIKVSSDSRARYKLNIEKIKSSLSAGVNKGTSAKKWDDIVYPAVISADISNPGKVSISFGGRVINDNFKGVGFQGDLFLPGDITEQEKEMIFSRARKLNPSIVRLFLMTEWWNPRKDKYDWESSGMKSLYETLDLYKSMGSEIILTVWRVPFWLSPDNSADNIKPLAESVSGLTEHLLKVKKYDNIKYLMVYNEPNCEYGKSFEKYEQIYRDLDAALVKKNIRKEINLTGPDEVDSYEWFRETAEKLDNLMDAYDSHNYQGDDDRSIIMWAGDRVNLLESKKIKKPWLITEFGRWREPRNYGRFVAEYAIDTLNCGASGLLVWEMQSSFFPGEGKVLNDWGLWGFRDTGWKIRPVYYAYSLLSRHIRRGIKIISSKSGSGGILSLAMKSETGKTMLLLSNKSNSADIEVTGEFGSGRAFLKYVYDEKAEYKGEELIEPVKIELDRENKLSDKIAEKTFVLYVQQ